MLEKLFIRRYILGRARGSVVKIIALLSVGGIGLGVMAMVVVLSVMQGFDVAIKQRLLGIQPHLIVTETSGKEALISKTVGQQGTVSRYTKQDVILRTLDGIFSGAVAQGFESETLPRLAKRVRHKVEIYDTPSGVVASKKSRNSEIDFVLGSKEIALGADLARSLGILEGDEVNIIAPESLLLPAGELPIYEKVIVKALLRTDVPDIDSRVVFYDVQKGLKKLQDTASLERGLEVRLTSPDAAPGIAKKLRDDGAVSVKTWQELNSSLFYSLKMEKTLMGVFLGLTILISSFSVVAVLVLLVTEKRADVGILKSMGATKRQIQRIFVSIGLFLGFLGIGGGVGLGLLFCFLLGRYPILKLPDIYYDTTVPVQVEYPVVIGIVLLGMILSFAGTLIPALRIAEYDPINAIRHDDG